MFLLRKPKDTTIRAFLAAQASQPFSYPDVGASRGTAPHGYNVDHNRIQIGSGKKDFARAVDQIRCWKMFDIGWLLLCWPDSPIEKGSMVGVLVPHFGFWSLNACKIVYVLNEHDGDCEKFGFAYGTLPGHAERGEERFTVELNSSSQEVWYEIYAFSRPGPAARLAYPVARSMQKRFAADSMQAMLHSMRNPEA